MPPSYLSVLIQSDRDWRLLWTHQQIINIGAPPPFPTKNKMLDFQNVEICKNNMFDLLAFVMVSLGFYGLLLTENGSLTLGDGSILFWTFLELSKFSPNMDPRTPYSLPKYFHRQHVTAASLCNWPSRAFPPSTTSRATKPGEWSATHPRIIKIPLQQNGTRQNNPIINYSWTTRPKARGQ